MVYRRQLKVMGMVCANALVIMLISHCQNSGSLGTVGNPSGSSNLLASTPPGGWQGLLPSIPSSGGSVSPGGSLVGLGNGVNANANNLLYLQFQGKNVPSSKTLNVIFSPSYSILVGWVEDSLEPGYLRQFAASITSPLEYVGNSSVQDVTGCSFTGKYIVTFSTAESALSGGPYATDLTTVFLTPSANTNTCGQPLATSTTVYWILSGATTIAASSVGLP